MFIQRIKGLFGKIVCTCKKISGSRHKRFIAAGLLLLTVLLAAGYIFLSHNEGFYKKTIARIETIDTVNVRESGDLYGNTEQKYTQQIKAVIMNGGHKGEAVELTNNATYSQVFDTRYEVDDEVFISIKQENGKIVQAAVLDLKRDRHLAAVLIIFILLIVFIGGVKGLRSLASLSSNILLSFLIIGAYANRWSILPVTTLAIILFILLSISFVNGINRKSLAAIIGTAAGTLISLLITVIVLAVTKAQGIYYEGMDILSFDPSQLFIVEILIGTLGGIMDIAITISSAVKELYDNKPEIDMKNVIQSGREIGKDIMGTMANAMIFAYISGSVPMIILWLKNDFSVFNIINYNLSLEVIRALTGSIGIVISIPVTLYIAAFFFRTKKGGIS